MSGMQFSRSSIQRRRRSFSAGSNAAEIRLSTELRSYICRLLARVRWNLRQYDQNPAVAAMQHKPCLNPVERNFECRRRLWKRLRALEGLKDFYVNNRTNLNRFYWWRTNLPFLLEPFSPGPQSGHGRLSGYDSVVMDDSAELVRGSATVRSSICGCGA